MFVFSNTILRQKVATTAATSTAAAAAACCHVVSSSSTQVSSRQLLHAASFANRTTNNVQRAAVPVRSLSSSSTTASSSSTTTKSGDHQSLIINAVGTDRLGIVHDMTKKVIAVGGNVGASQAAKLGNYFSLLMLVDVPTKEITTLTQHLQTMHDLSATVHHINDTKSSAASSSSSSTIGYSGTLTLEGADNPGIVHNVTKILSNNGLNIDRMETTDEIAPNGGSVLFRMNGIAHAYEPLSSGFDAEKIRNELNQLGDDLNCDIDLIDADDGSDGN